MEYLQVFPIHECKQYIVECCDLINSEWPRSKAARLQSLFMSSNKFPTSLVLILNDEQVVGHVKLTEIKLGGSDIIIESMVIHKEHRKKGWGKILMEDAEAYCQRKAKKMLYLSTRGQEGFYKKMGYEVCKPISYFGYCDITPELIKNEEDKVTVIKQKHVEIPTNVPPPPPLPKEKPIRHTKNRKTVKTFMRKSIS